MKTLLHPVNSAERIQSLDLLRGFAILGILIMNIQSYSMPGAAYMNPFAYGNLDGLNEWVWIFSHVFADQKFISIFSVLFGAGVVLVTQNAERKTGSSAGFHYRRTFWLLVIGLIHAHLIWYGDILVPYALCGLFVFLFRKVRPARLVVMGVVLISVHSFIYLMFGWSLPNWPEESIQEVRYSWLPDAALIQAEVDAVLGTLQEQITHNSEQAFFLETFVFLTLFLWRCGGLMLVGMGLYKWGILSAKKSKMFYIKGWIIGWLIGVPTVVYGMVSNYNAEFSMDYSMFLGSQFNYWGSLFVAFGYICAIMLLAKSPSGSWLKARLAAIGQMALSNYIAQSIIAVLIFNGVGLGLFGAVDRTGQLLIALCIWTIQLLWSKPWLKRHRFGPLEWVWRSLTYMKKQPLKRAAH